MSDPFPSLGDSSSGVLGAWNLDAAASSDDGLGDSLLVPPSPPPPQVPPQKSNRQTSIPTSISKNSFSSGFPLHFNLHQESPPSGLNPADSLLWPVEPRERPKTAPVPNPSVPLSVSRPPSYITQPKLGEVLWGYRLLSELGRGAFARVYLAEQTELGDRLVALKVSRADGDEPQMLARLQHTHIVPIHSVHDDPATDMRLMCMPYLGGANLAQVLEAVGARPAEGAGKISLVKALDEVSRRFQSAAGASIHSLNSARFRAVQGIGLSNQPRSALASLQHSLEEGTPRAPSLPAPRLGRTSLDRFQSLWPGLVWKKMGSKTIQNAPGLDVRDFDQPARQFLREANSIQASVWIIARLAEGLEHAHSRGLLHRDLKPSNILIAADGTPMLLDFNLSTPRRAKSHEESEKGMLGGTLPYMSPEHLDAFNPDGTTPPEAVDERSDIYSLGLILFETIAGEHPFHEPPAGMPMLKVISFLSEQRKKAPLLRAVVPGAPWSLHSIVLKCLDPDPDRRYSRARDLSEDLNRFLADRPLKHAPELSVRERVSKWERRNPRLCGNTSISIIAALLITSLGGLIALFSNNMQNLSARLKLQVFRQELDECRFMLNVTSGPAEHLSRGITLAKRTLQGLEIKQEGGLLKNSWLLRLTTREQLRTRQDAAELILLLARGEVDLAGRSGNEMSRDQALKWGITWLDRAERLDPDPPRALYDDRARYHAARGDAGLAARDRKRAADTKPVTARDFSLLGMVLLGRGNILDAETALIEATNLEPRRFWAWFVLGHSRFEQGRFLDAAADFQACILLEPKFAWPRMNRGLCLSRVGRLSEARTCYEQALEANPGFAEAWVNLALVDLELNDLPAAERAMKQAIARGRTDEAQLVILAEIKARSGDTAGAERLFAELLRDKGECPAVLAARGIFRVDSDREGALVDLRRAKELDPKHARTRLGLALALRRESPREALREAEAALDLDSSLVDAVQVRALLRARLGDLSALDDVERLCRLQTPHSLYNAACALAILVKTANETRLVSRAIEVLGRSLKVGMSVDLAADDSDLAVLRVDPAFNKLIAKFRGSTAPLER